MNYELFIKRHLVTDWDTGEVQLRNIVLKNVKTGKEALSLSRLFGLNQSSMMHAPGAVMSGMMHSEDYINFVNMGNKSFIDTGNSIYNTEMADEYWFADTIMDYCERIMIEYDVNNSKYDGSVEDMYKLFGMGVQDDN